jgi:cytoskeletal protein RodZ
VETVGTILKNKRETKRMTLGEVSRVTRVSISNLEAIEAGRFDELPGEVFARGFLRSYAQAVGMAPAEVLAKYTQSRRVRLVTPLPVQSPVQAARANSRRFGVAIAFVLLLILFTLALSIVLKPRGRDIPPELSVLELRANDVTAPTLVS